MLRNCILCTHSFKQKPDDTNKATKALKPLSAFKTPCTYFFFFAESASSSWATRKRIRTKLYSYSLKFKKVLLRVWFKNESYATIRFYDNFSHFSHLRTMLSASDLSQNPERSGLGGASAWAPVLCVLSYALSTSISMSGHMVKMDVCVHNVSPGNSGRTRWMMWGGYL